MRSADVDRFELDGLRGFHAPSPSPDWAQFALTFRVGIADEPLPKRGITHLVEHLALHGFRHPWFAFNAHVGETGTTFHATGRPDEVLGFARELGEALRALPADRIEHERLVLRTEEAGRRGSFDDRLRWLRFGNSGFGVAEAGEFGLRWLEAPQVDAWRDHFFTTGNAVVALIGVEPDGLELALPPGPWRPPPLPDLVPSLALPAFKREGTNGMGLTVTGPRTVALDMALRTVRERVHDRARLDDALVYGVGGGSWPLDGPTAHGSLTCDMLDTNAERVLATVLELVAEVAEHGPTEEELERERESRRRYVADPFGLEGLVDRMAQRLLHGDDPDDGWWIEEGERVTPAACAAALSEALPTALLVVPEVTRAATPDGFSDYATRGCGEGRPQGRVWRRREEINVGERRSEVVIGDDGIGVLVGHRGDECHLPWQDVVGVIRSAGGTYLVLARDSAWIDFRPPEMEDGDDMIEALARYVGDDAFVGLLPAEEQLEAAAEAMLPDVGLVAETLEDVGDALYDDERVVAMAADACEGLWGLVLVTTRRFMYGFVHPGEDRDKDSRVQYDPDEIEGAESEPGRLLLRLQGDETFEVTAIEPAESAAALADAVRELAAATAA